MLNRIVRRNIKFFTPRRKYNMENESDKEEYEKDRVERFTPFTKGPLLYSIIGIHVIGFAWLIYTDRDREEVKEEEVIKYDPFKDMK